MKSRYWPVAGMGLLMVAMGSSFLSPAKSVLGREVGLAIEVLAFLVCIIATARVWRDG